MIKKLIVSISTLTLCACLLCSCMPRGETISLDQSLDIAKDRFSLAYAQNQSKLPADVQTTVGSLKDNIDKLSTAATDSAFKEQSKIISESLKSLTIRAGYTSRASFDEISKQFVSAADENSGVEFSTGVAKLLAQRTLHMLAAELESTKFSL